MHVLLRVSSKTTEFTGPQPIIFQLGLRRAMTEAHIYISGGPGSSTHWGPNTQHVMSKGARHAVRMTREKDV